MPGKPRTAARAARQTVLRSWDTYVSEAQVEPFKLAIGDEVLEIDVPSGADMKSYVLAQQTGNNELALQSMFGEHADRIDELSAGVPFGALTALVTDVARYFGIIDDDGEPGESSASSTA